MMEEFTRKNPWLGLESYKEGEILYGRDDDIRDLTQNVLNDIDTLLYGKSGIGKSSILNAGVIPAARRHGYLPVLVRLSHKEKHPYLLQIKTAIEKAMIPIPVDEVGNEVELSPEELQQRGIALKQRIKKVVESRDKDKESLYEYFHRHTFHNISGERIKLLIIFDQFEEIFTLQADESQKKSFFAELADFLNDIMPSELQHNSDVSGDPTKETAEVINDGDLEDLFNDMNLGSKDDIPEYVNDNEIHLVFTIREDFLSEFEYYTSAIPSLKQNRYGLRPINEEQAAQIILRPRPGLINEQVAKLIIEKVTGRTDFEIDGVPEIEVDSAVLSLYLSRLYEAKIGNHITSELVEQKGGEIISKFYTDAISGISESTVEYLEGMLLTGKGRRDNITVFDAITDGGVSEEELDILCKKEKVLRLFNYAGDLRVEYVHDILCPVVKKHKEERIFFKQQEEKRLREEQERIKKEEEERKRQEQERIRNEEEKKRLLLEEKAKRDKIAKEAEDVKKRLRAEAIRIRHRNRRRIFLFIVIIFLLSTFGFSYYMLAIKEYRTSYLQIEIINGWPHGVVELDKSEARHQPIYYDLIKEGYWGKYTDIEVKSFCPKLPKQPRMDIFMTTEYPKKDKKGESFHDLLCQIEKIHFVEGDEGKVDKEVVYGKKNKILFIVSYFHLNNNESWIHFITNKAQPLQIRDNGVDRIKISKDSIGRIVSLMFYDQTGKSDIIDSKISGFYWRYVNDTTYQINLNIFGLPVQDNWNTIRYSRNNDTLITCYGKASYVADNDIIEACGPMGYVCKKTIDNKEFFYEVAQQTATAVRTNTYNKYGQILEESIKGHTKSNVPAKVVYSYQPQSGYMISKEMFNADGQPFDDGMRHIYKFTWDYNEQGMLTEASQYGINDKRLYFYQHNDYGNVSKSIIDDRRETASLYTERIDSVIGNKHIISFFDEGHSPKNHIYIIESDTLKVHKVKIEGSGSDTIRYFWVYDNDLKTISRAPTSCADNGFYTSYYCHKASYDSNGNCINFQKIDNQENILKSMKFYIQNGEVIGRSSMGLNGDAVRCPDWEEDGYTYYKMYYSKNFNGQFVNLVGVNEWDERSTFSNGEESLIVDYHDFISWQMTKNGQMPITINQHYYQQVFVDDPKGSDYMIPYVHYHRPNAMMEGQGLSDGDRLVQVGSWHIGQSKSLLEKAWNQLDFGKEVYIVCYKYTSNGLTKRELTIKGSNEATKSVTFHFAPLSITELTNWNKIYK